MKILIVGAGDAVTNLSATPFIRRWASDADNKIDLLVSTEQNPYFINNHDIIRIFRFNSHFCSRWGGELVYGLSILKALMSMRHERFDHIVSLAPVSPINYRLWKIITGVKSAGYFRGDFFVNSCQNNNKDLSCPDSAKAESRKEYLKLYPELQCAEMMAKSYSISLTSNNIGIIVNSAFSVKWTSGQWAYLISNLAARGRVFLISTGDNSVSDNNDINIMAEAESLCSTTAVTTVVTARTADFIAMISLCSGLISADSDATWVAASLRVPVIYMESKAVNDVPPGCKRVSSLNAEKVLSAFISNYDFTN